MFDVLACPSNWFIRGEFVAACFVTLDNGHAISTIHTQDPPSNDTIQTPIRSNLVAFRLSYRTSGSEAVPQSTRSIPLDHRFDPNLPFPHGHDIAPDTYTVKRRESKEHIVAMVLAFRVLMINQRALVKQNIRHHEGIG